jgi:O-antigen/teichoic acid export membrane protein
MMLTTKFSRDVLYTFSTQLTVLVIALFTHVILARILGAANLGIYTFVLLIAAVMTRFLTLGFEVSNIYFLGKKIYPSENIKSNTLRLWIFSGVTGLIILLLVKLLGIDHSFTDISPSFLWWVYPVFILLLFEELFISFFLGWKRIKLYNLLKLLRPLSYFLLLLFFILAGLSTLRWFLAGYVLSSGILTILLILLLKPALKKLNSKLLKESLRYGLKAYTANTVSFLNYRFDMFLVVFFLSPADLGYYAVAVMIGEKLWYLSAASSTILFPEIASSEEYDSSLTLKSSRFNFTIIMIAAILLGLFSHFLIRILYSTVYLPAATAIIFLLPGIVAMVIPKLLAADLTGRGKPQYAMIISIISFVLNFLLNVLLIPAYGIVGAAIASSISYIITAIIFIWIYHRETSTNLRDFFILKKTDLPRLRGLQ